MTALRAGLTGGALTVLAAGAALGLAAERYAVGQRRLRSDGVDQFLALPADRTSSVLASDGVALHVEEVGPREAALTVVFVHGYVNELAVWHFQRTALGSDNPGRLVFYDQRSHGRSGRSAAERSTIDQLGHDLHSVLDQVVPTGRIVLVGHSMGGMTIMALADHYPELFGPRVTGVALLSTSTGKLASITFGLPAAVSRVGRTLLPLLTWGLRRHPLPFETARRLGSDLSYLLTRREAFGDAGVSPSIVDFVQTMTGRVPLDVIAEFYDTFTSHDKLRALAVLGRVPTLVLVGSDDVVTPPSHSRAMAEAVPTASLVIVEGAGHMVMLERAALVTMQLRALLSRAARARSRSA